MTDKKQVKKSRRSNRVSQEVREARTIHDAYKFDDPKEPDKQEQICLEALGLKEPDMMTCDKCGKPNADYSVSDSGGVWHFHERCRPKEPDKMTDERKAEIGKLRFADYTKDGYDKAISAIIDLRHEIDALTQKVKDLEADNIKLQEGTLKIIEEQGTRIAEFEAERQSVIALKSRIELLSTGLQKWHKRATDLEAELKKKDDGLKKIKRWSENNLGQDAQEIIGKTVNKLLKDAPKKKVKK
jgi:cell division protein FtsB